MAQTFDLQKMNMEELMSVARTYVSEVVLPPREAARQGKHTEDSTHWDTLYLHGISLLSLTSSSKRRVKRVRHSLYFALQGGVVQPLQEDNFQYDDVEGNDFELKIVDHIDQPTTSLEP